MSDTKLPVAVIEHSDAAAEWATSAERTIVFSVTRPNPQAGEPVEGSMTGETEPEHLVTHYDMPAKPNPGLSLLYLKHARSNADIAASWLIETAIGEAGYFALADELSGIANPDDAVKLLQDIAARIQVVAMGGLDGSSHNPPKA